MAQGGKRRGTKSGTRKRRVRGGNSSSRKKNPRQSNTRREKKQLKPAIHPRLIRRWEREYREEDISLEDKITANNLTNSGLALPLFMIS